MAWYQERLYAEAGHNLQISRFLYRGKTGFQDIEIFDNAVYGRVLALDGIVQTTERDEFVYHEAFAHVPLFGHGAARRVLIVGGGDGGLLEEVLKHPVDHVTMVDIDGAVIELCRRYLPAICGDAFADPRLDLVIGDAARYVAETDRRFDIILVDSPDPVGPAKALFESPFYADCKGCMAPGGVIATQNGVAFLQGDAITKTYRRFAPLFGDRAFFLAAVPIFVGGFMAFGWGSDDAGARVTPVETLRRRYREAGFATRYYNPDLHRAAFALPAYVSDLMR